MVGKTLVPIKMLSFEETFALLEDEYEALTVAIQECEDLGDTEGVVALTVRSNELVYMHNAVYAALN